MKRNLEIIYLLTNPKKFYENTKDINTKHVILTSFIFSTLYFGFFLIETYLKYLNNDLSEMSSYFNLIFRTPFNYWILLYFILVGLLIFSGLILIVTATSTLIKIAYIIANKNLSYKLIWKIILFSCISLPIQKIITTIAYLFNLHIEWIIYFAYLWSFILATIGLLETTKK